MIYVEDMRIVLEQRPLTLFLRNRKQQRHPPRSQNIWTRL